MHSSQTSLEIWVKLHVYMTYESYRLEKEHRYDFALPCVYAKGSYNTWNISLCI